MMNRVVFPLALILAVAVHANTTSAATTQYSLNVPPSALQWGCFGPCACPIQENPTYGSFNLVFLRSDALYSYYAVENYIASFNNGPGAVAIVGSGQFKIGGEVAITQQMTLDLQVLGGPVQHFDSGVKPVSVPFPKIHAVCAAHDFACHDSVIVVDAGLIGTTDVPPSGRISGIQDVRPNPFGQAATIVVDRDRAGPVEVAIFDLNGSRIRRLGTVQLSGSASSVLVWNGRRDDGREATPGVYWVRMSWPGGADRRRVVKLN
jgi:hypothetical protein